MEEPAFDLWEPFATDYSNHRKGRTRIDWKEIPSPMLPIHWAPAFESCPYLPLNQGRYGMGISGIYGCCEYGLRYFCECLLYEHACHSVRLIQ